MHLTKFVDNQLSNNVYGKHSVAIYGGAYHLVANNENYTIDQVIPYLAQSLKDAKYFAPEVAESEVVENFCHLIMLDKALLEVYLGVRL